MLPFAPADPMQAALVLAQQAIGLSEPNPRVGCVIVSADGQQLLGQGHTQAAGSAHAEVMALRDAAARGASVRGATAYVTLEPCSHHGRTPPCCDALVAAQLARVVVAVGDPNPTVNGQGLARLRAAGLQVELAGQAYAHASRELNIGFFSRMQRGRPWLRLKVAGSLDGRSALANGVSQWITSAEARADGHRHPNRARR
jgi:diaminohydroxyphosphoribosylaminopyrimidine deaminase/5-amino-6-(5-phosphoribosylamino)uracil reductase